jgi:Spy/CpxP family protein refolding chaperone
MNRKILIAVGGIACALIAGAAYAMGPGGFGRGRMMKHMISSHIEDAEDLVQATPQQRVAIEQAKQNIFKALEGRMQNRRADHQKLIDALTGDNFDEAALYAIAQQHADEINALAKAIVPELKAVHDTLTKDQRQKLAAHIKEQAARHQGHGGGFGGPPEE